MRNTHRFLLVALLGLAATTAAADPDPACVEEIFAFEGAHAGDWLGYSLASAGDVNGDGRPDLVGGAPFNDDGPSNGGAAYVYSGADGTTLLTLYGESGNTSGSAAAGVGDLNGDGKSEVVVCSTAYGGGSGRARVHSGADGSVLYQVTGGFSPGQFGSSVAGLGDVDGDDVPDFAVGAFEDDPNGTDSGSVVVFSGVDGSSIRTLTGDGAFDRLGWSLTGIGDQDGDGIPDLAAGAFTSADNGVEAGEVRIFSGADGSLIRELSLSVAGDYFGVSVADVGDVNGDDVADLGVGARTTDHENGIDAGSAYVFSGADGQLLLTLLGDSDGDWFGFSVAAAGDVNGDGVADVLVGAPFHDGGGEDAGLLRVHSGADGSVLAAAYGPAADAYLGYSVAGGVDLDGDGRIDFAGGGFNAGAAAGTIRVFSLCADETPPLLACSVSVASLWPNNKKLIEVGLVIEATDESAGEPTIAVEVYSDEPTGGAQDATWSAGVLELRATRSGSGDGRVYLILVRATDAAGNESVAVCTVVVPHSASAQAHETVQAQASTAQAEALETGSAPAGYATLLGGS